MSTVDITSFTADDLLAMPDGKEYELVDGQLVERNMSTETSWIAGEIFGHLWQATRDSNLGWAFPSDNGYQCFAEFPGMVRRPDASFVRRDRLPDGPGTKGFLQIAPDLAVEVVSPNDLAWEVEEKAELWLSAGVGEVWVVMPPSRTVTIHRSDAPRKTMLESMVEIACEGLIPGFRCRVADFFPPVDH